MDEGPGQKYGEYRAPYEYGHCKVLKTPVAGYPRRFIHKRDKAPVTTGYKSLIVRIITYERGFQHMSVHPCILPCCLRKLVGKFQPFDVVLWNDAPHRLHGWTLICWNPLSYHFSDRSLKLQGFIGIVALWGSSGLYSDRIDTVPFFLYTFDRVLRKEE